MTSDKKSRIVNAVGFLSGVLASLDAVRDARTVWPLDALWRGLRSPQRLELGGGVALIVVTLAISVFRRREA
jgi:hypothetical protein